VAGPDRLAPFCFQNLEVPPVDLIAFHGNQVDLLSRPSEDARKQVAGVVAGQFAGERALRVFRARVVKVDSVEPSPRLS